MLNFNQKTCPSGRPQGYLIFHCLAQSRNSSSTDKTAIPRDLSAGERELIDLVINHDGDSDLGKNAEPKEFINSLIISDSDPEISEINYYGVKLEVKLWDLNFAKQIENLIPKALNK